MIFYLMTDEIETVKQAKPTKNGYEISFLDSKYGSIDYVFNFEWVDKQKGISYWKYSGKNKNIEDEEAYSFYAIDSLNYEILPKPKCLDCFNKKLCDELVRQKKEEKEKSKYITQWQGKYGFGFGFRASEENFEINFEINKDGSVIIINNNGKRDEAEIIRATKDTLELKGIENRQYILYKDKISNGGLGYAIRGDAVYLLNPPNNDYPLTKEK